MFNIIGVYSLLVVGFMIIFGVVDGFKGQDKIGLGVALVFTPVFAYILFMFFN